MINKINSIKISNNYIQSFGDSKLEQKNNNDNNKNMTNILLGSLTALAVIAASTVITLKHRNTKAMNKIGEMIVERPKVFTEEMYNQIAQEWYEKEFIKEGDSIVAIPMSILKNIAKEDKGYRQILKGMNMSDNGFAIGIMENKNQQIKYCDMRYIDPECNTMLILTHTLKNDRIYYSEIG